MDGYARKAADTEAEQERMERVVVVKG